MVTNRAAATPFNRIAFTDAMNRVLPSSWFQEHTWIPVADVVETKDAYLVFAELPGMEPSQVEMTFEKSVLTIRGTKPSVLETLAGAEARVYAMERPVGKFERSIRLPDFVDAERVSADLKHGVLTVTIPKAEAAQARRIDINAGVKPAERDYAR